MRVTNPKSSKKRSMPPRLTPARLDAMVEEATVDCHDIEEQLSGFFYMLEEHLKLPFVTRLLGVEVQVVGFDYCRADSLVAICERRGERCAVPLHELPLPKLLPPGSEWIRAYTHWIGQQ